MGGFWAEEGHDLSLRFNAIPSSFGENGFPRWCSGKESTCLCRRLKRHGFDSWVGKIPWSRKWQPTPVFLPGKSHGQRNPVGYSPWGCKELDMTEHACTHHGENERLGARIEASWRGRRLLQQARWVMIVAKSREGAVEVEISGWILEPA